MEFVPREIQKFDLELVIGIVFVPGELHYYNGINKICYDVLFCVKVKAVHSFFFFSYMKECVLSLHQIFTCIFLIQNISKCLWMKLKKMKHLPFYIR